MAQDWEKEAVSVLGGLWKAETKAILGDTWWPADWAEGVGSFTWFSKSEGGKSLTCPAGCPGLCVPCHCALRVSNSVAKRRSGNISACLWFSRIATGPRLGHREQWTRVEWRPTLEAVRMNPWCQRTYTVETWVPNSAWPSGAWRARTEQSPQET